MNEPSENVVKSNISSPDPPTGQRQQPESQNLTGYRARLNTPAEATAQATRLASRPFHSSLAQSSQLQQLTPQHHHIAPSRAPPSLRKVFDGIELPTLNDIRADERGKREDTNALLKTGSTLNGRLGFTKPRTIYSAGKSYSNEASTRTVSSDSLTRYAGTLRSVTPTNFDGQTFDHKNSHLDASRVLEEYIRTPSVQQRYTTTFSPSVSANDLASRAPLPPHETHKRNLRSASGSAHQRALKRFKPYQDELEEVIVLGTRGQPPVLVNRGQWPQHEAATTDGSGLFGEEVRETIEGWRGQLASSSSTDARHRPAALPSFAQGNPPAHFLRPRQAPIVDVRKLKDVRNEERKCKRELQASSTRSIVNRGQGYPDTRTIYSVDRQRGPKIASASVHDASSLSGQPLRDTSLAHRYTPTGQILERDTSNDHLDDLSTRESITTTQTSSAAHSPSLSPLTSSTSTLLKHQVLRKNLHTWSRWSSWKTVNAKTVSGAVFDKLVNREEIDLHGTAPRETFLVNLGQWPRYDHADAKEKILKWSVEVTSLAPPSEADVHLKDTNDQDVDIATPAPGHTPAPLGMDVAQELANILLRLRKGKSASKTPTAESALARGVVNQVYDTRASISLETLTGTGLGLSIQALETWTDIPFDDEHGVQGRAAEIAKFFDERFGTLQWA